MIYDIKKRVEKRLSQKQAFRECPNCTRYRIHKDSDAEYCILCRQGDLCGEDISTYGTTISKGPLALEA